MYWLMIIWQQDGCHGTVVFGDDPESVISQAINRKNPLAMFDGKIVHGGVFFVYLTPVTLLVPPQKILCVGMVPFQ
jgi:hypothetical protein